MTVFRIPMRLPPPNLTDAGSDFSESSEGGMFEGWVYGFALALPIAIYGVMSIISQHTWTVNTRGRGMDPAHSFLREWHGRPAMAIGLIYLGVGLFLHFHWFWARFRALYEYDGLGKLVSLIIFVAGIGWWIYEALQ